MVSIHSTSSLPPSLWADTALPAPERGHLEGHQTADVVVIGGGFTGLSASLALALRGLDVALLEAGSIGWGASGRNGGQVIPGLKHDPEALVTRYGTARAEQMIDVSGRNTDVVFELIKRFSIDCDATRQGWIQPAATRAGLNVIEARARQWSDRGVQVGWLDHQQCAERLGTHAYLGGWHDPRAGGLNPLSYARGLAMAAESAGARLLEHSPATTLQQRGEQWRVTSSNGSMINADQVILCTNGYTNELHRGLSRSLISAYSYQVATRPLTEAEGESILPGGEVVSDARKLLLYFRRDQSGRLLMGGRGPFHEPRTARDFRHLENALLRLYPALRGIDFEYRWAGRVALTQDALPHIHQPAPGLTVALGYNGRGVGMATHLGKLLGEALGNGQLTDHLPFDVTPVRKIPLHGLQRFYVSAVINYFRIRDWLER